MKNETVIDNLNQKNLIDLESLIEGMVKIQNSKKSGAKRKGAGSGAGSL